MWSVSQTAGEGDDPLKRLWPRNLFTEAVSHSLRPSPTSGRLTFWHIIQREGATSAEAAAATSLSSNGCGERGNAETREPLLVAPSSSLISPRKSDASLSAAQLRLPRPAAAAATDPSSSVTEAAAAAAPRDHLHVGPLGRRRRRRPRIGGPDASRSGRSSCRATLRRRWLIHNKLDKQNGWKIAAAARSEME